MKELLIKGDYIYMYIETKKRANSNEDMFIFYFKDRNDLDGFISFLNRYRSILKEAFNNSLSDCKYVKSIIEKIDTRKNTLYKKEDSELSSFLYSSEMASFTQVMILTSVNIINYYMKELINKEHEYIDLQHRHIDLQNEYLDVLNQFTDILNNELKEKKGQ